MRTFFSDIRDILAEDARAMRRAARCIGSRSIALRTWWGGVHPKRIEAIGFLIILAAALWEALALRRADSIVSQWIFEDIDAKLKHIFRALGSGDPRKYFYDHGNEFISHFDVIDRLSEIKTMFWIEYYSMIRIILFVVGSILVVLAKWREGHAR